jgi:hypothetical protein
VDSSIVIYAGTFANGACQSYNWNVMRASSASYFAGDLSTGCLIVNPTFGRNYKVAVGDQGIDVKKAHDDVVSRVQMCTNESKTSA